MPQVMHRIRISYVFVGFPNSINDYALAADRVHSIAEATKMLAHALLV